MRGGKINSVVMTNQNLTLTVWVCKVITPLSSLLSVVTEVGAKRAKRKTMAMISRKIALQLSMRKVNGCFMNFLRVSILINKIQI